MGLLNPGLIERPPPLPRARRRKAASLLLAAGFPLACSVYDTSLLKEKGDAAQTYCNADDQARPPPRPTGIAFNPNGDVHVVVVQHTMDLKDEDPSSATKAYVNIGFDLD